MRQSWGMGVLRSGGLVWPILSLVFGLGSNGLNGTNTVVAGREKL
jgi:hypothetical protein